MIETGRPIAHVAKEIGVGEQLLGKWVALAKARTEGDDGRTLDADERAELERLPHENSELRLDREFLKKGRLRFHGSTQHTRPGCGSRGTCEVGCCGDRR
ncbi:transposase [Streptomyces sp. NPDC058171]